MVMEKINVGFFGDIPVIANRLFSLDNIQCNRAVTRKPEQFTKESVEVTKLEEPYHDCVESILSNEQFDVLVTAGFPVILTENELSQIGFAINVHKGLLPKNRGRHAIATALSNNSTVTGVTVHEIDPEIDGGALLDQGRVQVGLGDDYNSIRAKTDIIGADLVETVLKQYISVGDVPFEKQNEEFATYYEPRVPEDSRIDWSNSSAQICKQVSAASDEFSAFSYVDGNKITINSCSVFDEYDGVFTHNLENGTVLEATTDWIIVTTDSGTLVITEFSSNRPVNIQSNDIFSK